MYGPKASGAWPGTCTSLIGPQGASGGGAFIASNQPNTLTKWISPTSGNTTATAAVGPTGFAISLFHNSCTITSMTYYSSVSVGVTLAAASAPAPAGSFPDTTVSCAAPASPPGFGTCTGLPFTVPADTFLTFRWQAVGTAGNTYTHFVCQ